MNLKLYVLTGLLFAMLSCPASAGTILFNLRDTAVIEPLDEAASFMLTKSGVTATLTASAGELNVTTSGFGVNYPGPGDDTDALDGALGLESVSVTFDVDVYFESLTLSIFSPGETATLNIASFPTVPLSDTGSGADVFSFSSNNLVSAGQAVVLAHESGNGFSFDSFSVSTVPEPSSAAIILGGILIGVIPRRRRNH